MGASVEAGIEEVGKLKAAASLRSESTAARSFAQANTGSTTSTSGKSFLLTIPAIDSNKGYRVGLRTTTMTLACQR